MLFPPRTCRKSLLSTKFEQYTQPWAPLSYATYDMIERELESIGDYCCVRASLKLNWMSNLQRIRKTVVTSSEATTDNKKGSKVRSNFLF
eukprot:scaffold1006_cov114-Skeletonema_dohrnii-CCMP3373.AAC.5